MQTTLSSKHMDLTTAIEEYTEKKVARLTRYFDRILQVEVIIDKLKNGYTVEIIVDVEKHDPIISSSENDNLYACIDLGVDRVVRQLSDHKSRLRDNKHTTPMSGNEG